MDNRNDIWVVVESSSGAYRKVALELISRAAGLASRLMELRGTRFSVWAVITGTATVPGAEEMYRFGADGIMTACHPRLEEHRTDLHAAVLASLVEERGPEIVLFGATAWGSEVAPTVAARVKTGLAAHCVDLRINHRGLLVQLVPAFGGKVLGEILCPVRRPQMASVRPGVFRAEPLDREGSVETLVLQPVIPSGMDRIEVLEVQQRESSKVPLEEAGVVIAGGWGVGSRENWQLLEDLAGLLGGTVGCTRPALDEGWAGGEDTMIGVSGKTVRPKVYLGFGISGSTHHVVGMKDSGLVFSVNTNPEADIFSFSDLKVVADARAVASALIEGLKAAGYGAGRLASIGGGPGRDGSV